MASISVRKLDNDTLKRLKIQATYHGVSMEEEARKILTEGVSPRERVGDAAVRIFEPLYGDYHLDIPQREVSDPIDFEE